MVIAIQGIEFLRGHVKEDVKFYTTINDCKGVQGNKDPNIAKFNISIRTYHTEDIPSLEERVLNVVKGAAMMTGTTVNYKKVKVIDEKFPSLTLNQIIMDNAKKLNAPNIIPFRKRTGSTDFGRVTQMVPGAVSRFALVPEGVTTHSKEFLAYGKSKEAYDGMIMGAKILAYTVADLITKPELMEKAKKEFKQRKNNKKKGGKNEKEI
jgi:metal-dependent amidase/aminoacylase/carboxypeptidase family protein